ncbi:MAG: hypothetical protein ACM3SP_01775, partial [Chloroflexota bacterium]
TDAAMTIVEKAQTNPSMRKQHKARIFMSAAPFGEISRILEARGERCQPRQSRGSSERTRALRSFVRDKGIKGGIIL